MVNLRETQRTSKLNIKRWKVAQTLLQELPLTGALPSKESEIRGAIVLIAKTNKILRYPINKLFPIENTYQDTIQAGTAGEQNLRWEAALTGELKRKYEC